MINNINCVLKSTCKIPHCNIVGYQFWQLWKYQRFPSVCAFSAIFMIMKLFRCWLLALYLCLNGKFINLPTSTKEKNKCSLLLVNWDNLMDMQISFQKILYSEGSLFRISKGFCIRHIEKCFLSLKREFSLNVWKILWISLSVWNPKYFSQNWFCSCITINKTHLLALL